MSVPLVYIQPFLQKHQVYTNAVKTEKPKRKNPKENLPYTTLEHKNSP